MGFAASSSFASNFSQGLAANATPWLAPLAGWLRRRAVARKNLSLASLPEVRPATQAIAAPAGPARPLRVLRVVDGAPRQCAGRMVISGRMADVCAELDRLAAREAQRTHDRRPGAN